MTRDEAVLKLLHLGPMRHHEMLCVTGWPTDETREVLRGLRHAGKVVLHTAIGERWYELVPESRPVVEKPYINPHSALTAAWA